MSDQVDWQPIETAPTDGQLIFCVVNGVAVLACRHEGEWRIASFGRNWEYGLHGNYRKVEPQWWLPYTDEQMWLANQPKRQAS